MLCYVKGAAGFIFHLNDLVNELKNSEVPLPAGS
jgi:hypothetical protein